ncbi:MAG: PqqD family protein [Candidatus Omnitrophota bacterium]
MEKGADIHSIYKPSENVVAREIEGELIIVPLVSGIGDSKEELYALNETGKSIWEKLDGKTTLENVVKKLGVEFNAPVDKIEKDVFGLVGELLKRRMLIEA